MNKHCKYLLLLFGFLIFFSCDSKKAENIDAGYEKIAVDNSQIEPSIDVSEIVARVEIIPLKETKGNYMSNIYKLYSGNDCYIAFDRLGTKKINLFGSDGTFIKTVFKVGDSLNQGINITDCWINYNNELEVYDYAQMKIFKFDTAFVLKSTVKANDLNHFVSIKRLPNSSDYIAYANYSQYNQSSNGKPFHIAVLDSNLNISGTYHYFDKLFQGISTLIYPEHFYPYKDSLRFIESYNNYVYNATKNGIRKRFKILYKKNPLPDNIVPILKNDLSVLKDQHASPNEQSSSLKKYASLYGTWLENDKYIYFSSLDGNAHPEIFVSLYDKNNHKIIFNSKGLLESKKYKLRLPQFDFYDHIKNEFLSVVDGKTLKEEALLRGSELLQTVQSDCEMLYLIKVKFK